MKVSTTTKYAALPAALGLAVSLGLASPAAADTNAQQAAQAAVDQYGGCTINVESDDYNDKAAWEVELKNTNVDNGANGRIEVKIDKATGKVLNKEDADSDDGECNPDFASATNGDTDNGNNDSGDNEGSDASEGSGSEGSDSDTDNGDTEDSDSSGSANAGGSDSGDSNDSGTTDNGTGQGMDDELAETGPESAGLYGGIAAGALALGAGLIALRRKVHA